MLGASGGVAGVGGGGGVQKIDMSLFTSVASLRSSHTMGPAVVGSYAGGGGSTTASASPSSVVGAAAPPPPAIGSARTGVTTTGVARQYPTTFLGPTISTVPPSPTRSKGSPLGAAGATGTAAPSRTGTSYVEALQRQRQEIADRVLAQAQQHRVTRRDSRARSPSSAQSSTAALLVESTNKGGRAKAAAAQRPASQSPSRNKRSTSPPSSLERRDVGRPRTTGNAPLPPSRTASPRTQAAIQRLATAEAAGRKRIVEAAFLVYQSLDTLHRLPTPPPSPRRRSPRQSPSGLTSQRGAAPAVAPMGFLAPRLLQTSAASDDDALSQRFDIATPFSATAAASPSTHGGVGSAAFSTTHEAATMQQRVEAELHSLRVLKTELQARDAMREAEWQAEKVLWAQERRDFANALQQLKSELDAEKKVSEGLRVQLRMACRALRPGHAVGSSAPLALEP